MNILITGSRGFIGKNLMATLENIRDGKDRRYPALAGCELAGFDIGDGPAALADACARADAVVHLAGVNRPKDDREFMTGNLGALEGVLALLATRDTPVPVLYASSTQAERDNPYGQSKRAGEQALFAYQARTGAACVAYRFPNVFGKWSRPGYNSAVATFCHQIARGLPITVNDPDARLTLVYIDDVVDEILAALLGQAHVQDGIGFVPTTHEARLGHIADLLYSFRQSRETLAVPDVGDALTRKLYATYLSFLPEDNMTCAPEAKADARGTFTELLRTPDRGQLSVNTAHPGITKGNHWHHTKHEKFMVVRGQAVISMRRVGETEVIRIPVTEDTPVWVEMCPGYTHAIENTGAGEMTFLIWANEPFDPDRPDTYFLEV